MQLQSAIVPFFFFFFNKTLLFLSHLLISRTIQNKEVLKYNVKKINISWEGFINLIQYPLTLKWMLQW